MRFKEIGPVTPISGNPADLIRRVPQPGCLLDRRVVDQLLACTSRAGIEQLHRFLCGRIFVVVRHNEQLGAVRKIRAGIAIVAARFSPESNTRDFTSAV
jgi:hypothetical protein